MGAMLAPTFGGTAKTSRPVPVAGPQPRRRSYPLTTHRTTRPHGWPQPGSQLTARPDQVTGIRLALVTHRQPELPRSHPADGHAKTMDFNHLSAADAATYANESAPPPQRERHKNARRLISRLCRYSSRIFRPAHYRMRNRSLPRIKCEPRGPLRMPSHLTSSNLVPGGAVIRTTACPRAGSRGLMLGRASMRERALAVTSTEPT